MSEPLRLSLAVSTVPRSSSYQDKDALVVNAFIDKSASQVHYLVKRPGYTLNNGTIVTGNFKGIFINPNNPSVVYYISSTESLLSY